MIAIADAETHQILGAAILGTGGDEAIHGILDAMNARIPFTATRGAHSPDRIGTRSNPPQ
jgi:pyruvate/2-oxoglutarate dehydrogenase complex dihydrolipoamide dehydrogenase (E3) component